jgi:hypothetical protein
MTTVGVEHEISVVCEFLKANRIRHPRAEQSADPRIQCKHSEQEKKNWIADKPYGFPR